jgi:hypothetical protein
LMKRYNRPSSLPFPCLKFYNVHSTQNSSRRVRSGRRHLSELYVT